MTTLTSLFTYVEAQDSQEDDMYVLKTNELIHIQDASAYGSGFVVMKEDNDCFYNLGNYPTLGEALTQCCYSDLLS